MNLKFIVNDYVLIWNLLFQASISENIHRLKQKIWINYKVKYNIAFADNNKILSDPKNFIPDDDTIYNIVMENKEYERIRKNTDKYRVKLLELWDSNKKASLKELKDILRFDAGENKILVVSEKLDTVQKGPNNVVVWGKKIDSDNAIKTLVSLVHFIIKDQLKDYKPKYQDVVDAVVELAIINEYATRIMGTTNYLNGDNSLSFLKRQIYPYWLMYLGVKKEDMNKYMNRDRIGFDVEKYTYEGELKKLDLFGFIDFCITNQKYIVKIEQIEIL